MKDVSRAENFLAGFEEHMLNWSSENNSMVRARTWTKVFPWEWLGKLFLDAIIWKGEKNTLKIILRVVYDFRIFLNNGLQIQTSFGDRFR